MGLHLLGSVYVEGLEKDPIRALYPRNPRTHIPRLLGPKTILCKAFGLL